MKYGTCVAVGILALVATALADNLALLSGTLRTFQVGGCDGDSLNLTCPSKTTISVQIAQYGKNSAICEPHDLIHGVTPLNSTCLLSSAIQSVVTLCQKKGSCGFQAAPQTFGDSDPCPGVRKLVEVAFKCRPSEFKSLMACEGEVLKLKCSTNERIAVYLATFGRTEYESLKCPQPMGVGEETCLASYATETVMQMCHGKRKCTLNAEPSTFGSPCKQGSRNYLKVIHTCVPRSVLREKYHGVEGDEFGGLGVEGPPVTHPVVEEPISAQPLPTRAPNQRINSTDAINKTKILADESPVGPVQNSAISKFGNEGNETGVRVVYFISQGILAYDFISRNSEKFYLFLALSVTGALLLLFLLLLVRVGVQRRRVRKKENGSMKQPSSMSGTTTFGLTDIDDLSLDPLSPERESLDLHSILRRSSPSQDFSIATSTLGRNSKKEGVRFSNHKNHSKFDENSENPRSLRNSNSENLHFFYG